MMLCFGGEGLASLSSMMLCIGGGGLASLSPVAYPAGRGAQPFPRRRSYIGSPHWRLATHNPLVRSRSLTLACGVGGTCGAPVVV